MKWMKSLLCLRNKIYAYEIKQKTLVGPNVLTHSYTGIILAKSKEEAEDILKRENFELQPGSFHIYEVTFDKGEKMIEVISIHKEIN